MAPGAFVTILLPGNPRGKGRPRFGKAGNFVRVWTDRKTSDYEKLLAAAGREAMNGLPVRHGAVSVQIEAALPIPISWSRKKRAEALAGDLLPTGKPDFDNIAKCVGDGLNGVVWHDDSQIVVCSFRKVYGRDPCLIVSAWDWF